jgi:hypothetical protein
MFLLGSETFPVRVVTLGDIFLDKTAEFRLRNFEKGEFERTTC